VETKTADEDGTFKSRMSRVEGRSSDATAATSIGEYPGKKSAMEIAFGKINGIMEELKDEPALALP